MGKKVSIILALIIITCLTACNDINLPTESLTFSDNCTSLENSSSLVDSYDNSAALISSESLISSDALTTSEDSSSSADSNDDPSNHGLRGEKLAAQFEWPYDDPIDLTDASVIRIITNNNGDIHEEIPLSEISEECMWFVTCDYGYISVVPGNGDTYEYKKYKAGDKVGDLTVSEIKTRFSNEHYKFKKYFAGARADFEGEITLVGEFRLTLPNGEIGIPPISDIEFVPNEESRKKLPIVNFLPLIDIPNNGFYDWYRQDHIAIELGRIENYPKIDFSKIPADGSPVSVKITIKNYAYLAEFGLPIPFSGFADIVDLEII